jgi:hypothetical protein
MAAAATRRPGQGEGEVLAASLGCREVVVNVPTGPDDEQPCLGEITQKSVAGKEVYIYMGISDGCNSFFIVTIKILKCYHIVEIIERIYPRQTDCTTY